MSNKHMKNNDINNEINNNKKQTSNNTKKRNKKAKKIITIILAILIIFAGIFGWNCYKSYKENGLSGLIGNLVGSDTKKPLDEIQFLLMGKSLDLTDTIMICSYNPKTQEASMVSVPRDTFVGSDPQKPSSSDKINAQYHRGGVLSAQKTINAVNKVTGLDLKYYVLVDTDALKELIDTIGGVDFYVPTNMNYHDTSEENFLTIELKEGMQRIDGNKAEQLLRFRHNDDGSTYPASYGPEDIGRMRTQREFITATLKQTLKPSNILKIGDFIDIASRNIETNLSISLLKDYIPYAVEFNTENLSTSVLPGSDSRPDPKGPYVYMLKTNEVQELIAKHFFKSNNNNSNNTTSDNATQNANETDNSDANQEPKTLNLQILNGSENPALLREVVKIYQEKGYNVLMVGNTSKTKKSAVINRTKQDSEIANEIKSVINCNSVTTGKSLNDIDFTITIGQDYN